MELQRREGDSLNGILVLELSQDLPITALPQSKLIALVPKTNGRQLFLIDGAASKNGTRSQFVAFSQGELGMPDGRLHIEPHSL